MAVFLLLITRMIHIHLFLLALNIKDIPKNAHKEIIDTFGNIETNVNYKVLLSFYTVLGCQFSQNQRLA